MEKINIILLAVICLYLLVVYVKSRKGEEEKDEKKEIKLPEKETNEGYYPFVIAAVVSGIMKEKPYRIKRVFLVGKESTISSWKTAGKSEAMLKRMFFKK